MASPFFTFIPASGSGVISADCVEVTGLRCGASPKLSAGKIKTVIAIRIIVLQIMIFRGTHNSIAKRLFYCEIDAQDQQFIPGIFDIAVGHAFDDPVDFSRVQQAFQQLLRRDSLRGHDNSVLPFTPDADRF